MWAVNKLREMRGMNGFTLRPHAGEVSYIPSVLSPTVPLFPALTLPASLFALTLACL